MICRVIKVLFFINGLILSIYGANRCFTCKDASCLGTSQWNKTIACGKVDDCITLFNEHTPIRKGCYSTLTEDEKFICDSKVNVNCYKCPSDNCNNMGRLDHRCTQCDSRTNLDCLNNPIASANRCKAPRTDEAYCYTQIINGSGTKRGCISTFEELKNCNDNKSNCLLCDVTKYGACNLNEFPVGRRKCYNAKFKCTTTNCLANTTTSVYCNKINDQCTAINQFGNIKQSCNDQLTVEDIKFCTDNPNSCKNCQTTNCNNQIPIAPAITTTRSPSITTIPEPGVTTTVAPGISTNAPGNSTNAPGISTNTPGTTHFPISPTTIKNDSNSLYKTNLLLIFVVGYVTL